LSAVEEYPSLPTPARYETDVGPILLPRDDLLIAEGLRQDGAWEPEQGEKLRELVAPGMTVIDVGAHVGYFTLMLASLVGPEGQVLAIEPEPYNHLLLGANLARAGMNNVITHEAAAWRATEGPLRMSLCNWNTGDNRVGFSSRHRAAIEVASLALDDLNPPRVDLIKLDTQATEHIAIEGATRLIERHSPVLFAELWPGGLRELGIDPADPIDVYEGLGYRIEVLGRPDLESAERARLIEAADAAPTKDLMLLMRRPPAA
jgi:FkbM family methyltransferase